jgi:hypothetical protein
MEITTVEDDYLVLVRAFDATLTRLFQLLQRGGF